MIEAPIHTAQAYIHPKARIGKNVTIMPFSYIDKDVEIGDNTWIAPNVTVFEGSRIGNNCKIFPGAVIGAIPQDLKFNGEYTTAEIGNNTTIRECVTINRGTADRFKTVVGNNCLLMAYSHVAHDCMVGNNVILANSVNIAGHVTIDDYAILEGLAAVQQFIHIGSHTFISGGSLVRKNVPPFIRVAHEPLSYIGVNKIGLERRGFEKNTVQHIDNIYHILFVKYQNTQKALQEIINTVPQSDYKDKIIHFVQTLSPMGVIKGHLKAHAHADTLKPKMEE